MQPPPIPHNEQARLAALAAYGILDTPPEDAFDDIVRLASEICGTPIAVMSLVDRDRQWFKSVVGLDSRETPRSVAFCAHAILQKELFTVPDALSDPRFADNPFVVGDPGIRFYSGSPIRGADGLELGTLCVIDHTPRELTALQKHALVTLGRQIEAQLELRLKMRELSRQEALMRATAQRERDQAIRERDRFFELSVDPMCIAGVDGYFKRVNTAFERALGHTAAELTSRPYLDFVHPDDVQKTTAEAENLASGGLLSTRFENRYRAKDGSYRWIAWATVTILEEGLIYAIARDVTEKKLLESQLLHSQKMEAVGRLAGGIAHDFNNLLSAILGFGQLIEMELPPGSQLLDDMQQVVKAGERAANLTRQLLLFSRKSVVEPPRRIRINALVADLDKMLRRVIGTDIELETRLAEAMWPVRIDSGHLEQVVMNLVINARDAMAHGGKLTIETANVVLDAGYARAHAEVPPGEYVALAVSDTGCGMTKETEQRIFEPFFTTKEVGKGTGLGLATVFGIVKEAGGHIWVYSELGHGTTFKIYLPRASDGRKRSDMIELRDESARGVETILLVEDEPMVRELARRVLASLGYTVLHASRADEAIELMAAAKHVDLLITDIIMPGMRGHELAARLRQEHPQLDVLFMSGYTENALDHQQILDGLVHFIEKPLSARRLARIVREILDADGP
jgi:PAS domain S-box-containing protein